MTRNEGLLEENRVLREEVNRCHQDIDKLLRSISEYRDEVKSVNKVNGALNAEIALMKTQLPKRDKTGKFIRK